MNRIKIALSFSSKEKTKIKYQLTHFMKEKQLSPLLKKKTLSQKLSGKKKKQYRHQKYV